MTITLIETRFEQEIFIINFHSMFAAIITILGGLLAASSFIIAKKPNAKELLDKLVPYQGWIGVVLFIWGVWGLIGALQTIGIMGYIGVVSWVFILAAAVANLLVGFILGFALISKYALSKNEAAMKKGEEIRGKLLKYQIPLGFLAIIVGVLYIVLVRY